MSPKSKKILIAVGAGAAAVVVLVFAAVFVYVKFIKGDPPKAFDESSLDSVLGAATTVAPGDPVTTTAAGTAAPDATATTTGSAGSATGSATPSGSTSSSGSPGSTGSTGSSGSSGSPGSDSATGTDGTWNVTSASTVGYRVKETLAGLDTEGAGRTSSITGTMTISGPTVTAVDLTVDMTTFKSDDSRRDGQFNGRIMEVSTYPTATFTLTSPIDLGAIPADGTSVSTKATGDLTLHGVTKPVTFDLTAKETNGLIGVVGATVITFADYRIVNPSNGFAETGATGTMELQLVFQHA
ncbi:MAG: YceI family protein [Ilumatobacteraceae bacterium]|nr:YceI family protein [Ilumatobacteraceae bacterium]